MLRKIGLLVAAVVVLLPGASLGHTSALGPDAALVVQEAPLAPGGEAYELNPAGPNALLLSDYGAGEIRRIDAVTGAFVAYQVPSPIDARLDPSGRIWFAGGGATFGFVDPAGGALTTWTLPGDPADYTLSGTAFDDAGRVWLSEWFGSASRLRRFDPASRQLCVYALPGGVSSDYVLYREGAVWTANWGNDYVYRYDPAAGQGQRWYLGGDSFPQGIAIDGAGNVWLADVSGGTLLRLSPADGQLASFPLPAGSSPRMLTLIDGQVWVTESDLRTVGMLDPAVASPTITTAPGDTFTLSAACSALPAGTVLPLGSTTGSLAWTDNLWQEVAAPAGWTVYQLPAGASPYGITGYAGQPWVVDNGRQVLARALGPASTGTPTPTPTATRTVAPGPSPTPTTPAAATATPTPSATATGAPSRSLFLPLIQR